MVDKIIEVEKCPICTSENFTLIREVKYQEGLLRISRCDSCSVSFSSTRFSDEYLNIKYYKEGYEETHLNYRDYGAVYSRSFQSIVDKIKRIKSSGKWLDIGCGKGYLLSIAQRNNYDCYGIDIRKTFINSGKITYFSGNLFEAGFNDNEFDIITIISVLEHIGSPKEYLQKIRCLLKPNGILFIHVPNEYYFNKKGFSKFTNYSPNVHLVNYSHKNIACVLNRFNFSKVEFTSPKYFTSENKKKRMLVLLLEIFNAVAIKWNRGIWIAMQVIAFDETGRVSSISTKNKLR